MFLESVGRTLLSQETAVELDILCIGPVEASSVSGEIDSDTCTRDVKLFVQRHWAVKRVRVETTR